MSVLRVAVCVKQVPDPDAVNSYAQWNRLRIDPETKEVALQEIPLLMNAYDEQAIEAALRLRDNGASCHIAVLTFGGDSCRDVTKHAFAMGADEGVHLIASGAPVKDRIAVAHVLAQAIRKLGGADLVLCGRQASDGDQGVIGPALAELLGLPSVSLARDISHLGENAVRVVRVLPEGEETVDVALPALVTISSELGTPRYPTMRGLMDARRKEPISWTLQDLSIDSSSLIGNHVQKLDMFVPEVKGECEFIRGTTVDEMAACLADVLHNQGLI